MYGNNFNPYIMPNMSYGQIMRTPIMPTNNYRRGFGGLGALLGLSSGGISRGINWSNLLNNTSKTLGVIKQAIPVVKEVQPMLRNMRSIVKIASAFKDETDTTSNDNNIKKENSTTDSSTTYNNKNYNNEPNFFI